MWIFLMMLFLPRLESAVMILDPKFDDFDNLELVNALLKNDFVDLADSVLKNLPQELKNNSEGVLLKTKILGKQKKWIPFLEYAENIQNKDVDELKVYAFFETKQWENCSLVSDHGISELVSIKYGCAIKAQKPDKAWEILRKAPKNSNIIKLQIKFLLDQNLIQEARSLFFLKSVYLTETDLFLLLDQFKEKKANRELMPLLEYLRIAYPDNTDLLLYYAQFSFGEKLYHAAADAFSLASFNRPTFAYHGAEVLRNLKKFDRSRFMQFFIPEEKQLLKQKMALWLDQGKFREISTLKRTIPRSELRADDEANYTLAYSLLKTGQLEDVTRPLNRVIKAELLPKATALQKIWESCQLTNNPCKI
jgi:hypothetical protein